MQIYHQIAALIKHEMWQKFYKNSQNWSLNFQTIWHGIKNRILKTQLIMANIVWDVRMNE